MTMSGHDGESNRMGYTDKGLYYARVQDWFFKTFILAIASNLK